MSESKYDGASRDLLICLIETLEGKIFLANTVIQDLMRKRDEKERTMQVEYTLGGKEP